MRMDYWEMSSKLHLRLGTEKRDDNRKTSGGQGGNEGDGGMERCRKRGS